MLLLPYRTSTWTVHYRNSSVSVLVYAKNRKSTLRHWILRKDTRALLESMTCFLCTCINEKVDPDQMSNLTPKLFTPVVAWYEFQETSFILLSKLVQRQVIKLLFLLLLLLFYYDFIIIKFIYIIISLCIGHNHCKCTCFTFLTF